MKQLLLGLLLFFSTEAISQSIVYAEAAGAGGLYSVNYDRRISEGSPLGGRIGIGYYGDLSIFPVQLNYIIGKGKHYLEISGGVSIWTGVTDFGNGTEGFTFLPTAFIKYRLQPQEKGFFLNIGPGTLGSIMPFWGGLGLGYVF